MCTGPIRIGRRCRLGAEASLQYNTEMLPGSALGEMSLLMKGEILPEGSRWHGIPARLVEMGPSPAQKKAAILETIATTQKVP